MYSRKTFFILELNYCLFINLLVNLKLYLSKENAFNAKYFNKLIKKKFDILNRVFLLISHIKCLEIFKHTKGNFWISFLVFNYKNVPLVLEFDLNCKISCIFCQKSAT